MKGHGEKRSRKEEAAISAPLTESGIAAAAKKADVSESTLRRWLRDRDFAKRCRSRAVEVGELRERLHSLVSTWRTPRTQVHAFPRCCAATPRQRPSRNESRGVRRGHERQNAQKKQNPGANSTA
jgi:hypothetical protein